MSKFITYLAIALAVYWVITAPYSAAHFVGSIFNAVIAVAEGITTFLSALADPHPGAVG